MAVISSKYSKGNVNIDSGLAWAKQNVLFLLLCVTTLVLFYNQNKQHLDASIVSRTASVESPGMNLLAAGGSDSSSGIDEVKLRGIINKYLLESNPLTIPLGEAQALPSIRVQEKDENRRIYGGKGDKQHLGGFTIYDGQGVSPAAWKQMIGRIGVKSVIDLGCGKGVSTSWFHAHGAKVLCLEGSHDAVEHTLLPDPKNQVVEHDFSRGPYWPADTYDAVWTVEFMEHVGRNFQYNYMQSFRKAALIFCSHSKWGGWHHVEVHTNDWWIERMERLGFKYSPALTEEIRNAAGRERDEGNRNPTNQTIIGPNGKPYNAQHVWKNMQVFINPVVSALPQHAHLFAEHGCYQRTDPGGVVVNRPCGSSEKQPEESLLPESFHPLEMTPQQDKAWLDLISNHIKEETDKSASAH